MALKFFIFILIISPFLLVDKSVMIQKNEQSKEEIPQISFVNATLFEIDDQRIDKMLVADKFEKFELVEKIENGYFKVRNTNNNSDTIQAKYIMKEYAKYTFEQDVLLKRDNEMTVKTDQLVYDVEAKIASNESPFEILYKNSSFSGENLYLNHNDYKLQGNKVHFRINTKDI